MAGQPSSDIVGTEVALSDELDEIERRRHAAQVSYVGAAAVNETRPQRATRLGLTALCLSGGGIRSAAFCLGVLQSLARKRLLNEFDYLSTVSGGGFIGGWLQVLIRETGDIGQAQADLATNNLEPLRRLRRLTHYLTPQSGPFSADIWAAIVMYFRNLLLNWMVFAPVFLLLALAAVFYRTLLASLRDQPTPNLLLLGVATASLAWSSWQGSSLVPSHRTLAPRFAESRDVTRRVVIPALVWSFLAPVVVNHGIATSTPVIWTIPACYAVAMLAGYTAAWLLRADGSQQGHRLYRENAERWVYATACSTVLTVIAINLIEPQGLLYDVATYKLGTNGPHLLINRETALTTLGPLWFLGTHVLHTTFYVGFRREALHADLDREWLGRLNGVLLLFGSVWTMFAVACLIVPVMLTFLPFMPKSDWQPLKILAAGAGTTIAGAIGAWIGKQVAAGFETYARQSKRWTRWLPNALSAVFAIGVFACGSSLLQKGLGYLALQVTVSDDAWWLTVILQLAAAGALFSLARWFGRVNVNRYSMHAMYRNRLARAFLGSVRRRRQPDPFTGFDPDDNPRFSDFARARAGQRLFPVINMTLNVTAGSNTATAQRKAECFTATPLTCGSASLRHPSQTDDQEPPAGAFVPTTAYAGMESLHNENCRNLGPHLGSLLTISGAAVSPNWGYHSAKLTAFLMTLFNVRLGVWLPNPANATADELQLAKPRNSETALFNELLGETTDTSQAIYLSDGGHFENLGVYEMLRRRCHRIIVVDAGQDGNGVFLDLGNVIRKARIDLDVEVTMQPMRIFSRKILAADKTLGPTALGIALGEIAYSGSAQGCLLYLKPCFLPKIPTDVRAYGESDDAFPHDTTLQQWFSESQFESYRALGRWQMEQLNGASLEDLFHAARHLAEVKHPAGAK